MKKITLFIALTFTCFLGHSQALNQPANWPNNSWTITGSYDANPLIFTSNPTVSSNFSFDDDEGGSSSINNINAESPVIDLTAAYNAGEFWISVNANYVFNIYQNESLVTQYWNADTNAWVNFGGLLQETQNAPTVNFCNGPFNNINSTPPLNIASFTPNQLSGFKYRVAYNDNGSYGWGFCYASPTITSQTPPACPNITNLSVTNVAVTTASIYWSAGSNETAWEIVIQQQDTGIPTGSGLPTSSNNPYNAINLTQNTAYEVYVRGNCGGGDYSNWIGPVNFTTLIPSRVNFIQQPFSVSGYDLTVVDMNGDFLDDIVSATSTNVKIFHQQSIGGFIETNITTPSADFLPGWSMAAADFDGNGYTDLLYASGSGVTFMRANSTGTGFTEISGSEYVFSQRSNFADINNDGHLDAFVCHDVAPNVYYINDGFGNLTFNQGGLGDYSSGGNYGSIWIDYDNDRDLDMFIAKCGGETARRTNQMLTNNGDGTFTENAAALGLADPMQTWSSSWGDYDNDGDMDLFVGGSSDPHKLMRNNGNGTFTNVTAASGVSAVTTLGHENVSYDIDNDGNLDILCNGVILYGNGDLTFTEIDSDELNYKNGSFGDLNNDGFIDSYYNNVIYWNNTTSNNWIKINTIGTVSNINGIGARVEIHTNAGTQIRDVRSGEGFEFMSTLNTHFGIGTEASINNITVYWPSGVVDNVVNPAINQAITITEGQTLSLENSFVDDLVIYPNPTKDILNIDASDNLNNAIYTIFDINGKRVLNSKLEATTIDVSTLSAGNYILRIISENTIKSQKFIKQ